MNPIASAISGQLGYYHCSLGDLYDIAWFFPIANRYSPTTRDDGIEVSLADPGDLTETAFTAALSSDNCRPVTVPMHHRILLFDVYNNLRSVRSNASRDAKHNTGSPPFGYSWYGG